MTETRSARDEGRRPWFPWSPRRQMRHPVLQRAMEERTFGERVADSIASFGGSWPFIFLFLGLIFGWMALNTIVLARVLQAKPFDPYPYIALNLLLSAMAGLQAPVILMSQNRAASRDEVLAEHHYEESQKIEQLLEMNTDLTREVHKLTVQIRELMTGESPAG